MAARRALSELPLHRLPYELEIRCASALEQSRGGLTFHFRPWWTEQILWIKVRGSLRLLVQHRFLLEEHLSRIPRSGFSRRVPGVSQIRRLAHHWQIELCPLSDQHQRLAAEIASSVPELPEILRLGCERLLAQRAAQRAVDARPHQDVLVEPTQRAIAPLAATAEGKTSPQSRKLEWHLEGTLMTPRWVAFDGTATWTGD